MALIRPITSKDSLKTTLPMSCTSTFTHDSAGRSSQSQLPPLTDSMTFQVTRGSGCTAAISQNGTTLLNIGDNDTTTHSVTISDFDHPITILITTATAGGYLDVTSTYNV